MKSLKSIASLIIICFALSYSMGDSSISQEADQNVPNIELTSSNNFFIIHERGLG